MKRKICILASGILLWGLNVHMVCAEEVSTKYSVDEVIAYFNEVVLDTEYATGEGDYTVVQKWVDPIYYRINGVATDEDKEMLQYLCNGLNSIEGFPGIYPEDNENYANMELNFWGRDNFYLYMGDCINYEEADGAVEYWYDNVGNYIHYATVGYRVDVDQEVRNSVILEEIVNGLGMTDTEVRTDSIAYNGYSTVQELSEMDWLLLELLYCPEIQCGMGASECEEIIRNLWEIKQ